MTREVDGIAWAELVPALVRRMSSRLTQSRVGPRSTALEGLRSRWYAGVMDDGELLASWRDGDRGAGDVLIGRYLDATVRFFRSKLGDDVQDIVQRTFLALLESSADFDPARPLKPYLFSIARNRLYDELRRRHRRPQFDPACSSLADLEPSPSQVAAQSEEGRLLKRALRRISLEHQIVLELFYWEGIRGADIAVVIGVSPHTVRSRLARAKTALRQQIEALADDPRLAASTFDGLERAPHPDAPHE